MSYNSLEEIVRECQEKDLPFDEVILLDDMNERNVSREESIETMRGMWEAMKGAERNYDGSLQSRSGLVGGAGKTMRAYVESGNTLCGPFVGKVMASALAMGESNACMKRIVAAPTAGACGVLPAVLVNYQKEKGTADEQIVRALYTAAGIGQVVAARAYIAGASGGCQAEIGTASAMAAGALTALGGGTPSQITHAAAMALKNLLGLVCDPVGGLVEVPCVKRNVIGSVNALSAADMALAGKRRFSRSRRAVENDGAEFIRLDRTVQQLSRADDVLLSNHLVQRCRAHARCEGGLFFHCGFFHIIKQIHVFFTPFFFLPFILSHFGGYPQPLNLGFSATMFDGIRGSYSSISSRTVTNVYPSSFNSFTIRRSASTVAR